MGLLLGGNVLGDGEDGEERHAEGHSGDGGQLLGKQVHDRRREQQQRNQDESNRYLNALDVKVAGNLPLAIFRLGVAQYGHDEDLDYGTLQIPSLCGHSCWRGPGQGSVRRNPATGVHQCTAFSAYRSVLDQFRRAFSIGCFAEAFRRAATQRDGKFTTEARRPRRKLYGTKTPCLCVGACPERSRRVVNDFRRSGAPAENFTPASSVGRAGAESKAPRLESTCYFRSVK